MINGYYSTGSVSQWVMLRLGIMGTTAESWKRGGKTLRLDRFDD